MHDEISEFVQAHIQKIAPLEDALDGIWWEAARTGSEILTARLGEMSANLRRQYADPTELRRVQDFLRTDLTDPVLRRELDLLTQRYRMNQLSPEALEAITHAEAEIEQQFNTARAELNGRPVSDNDVRAILHRENDLTLRRQAWEASKEVGARVADRVIALVKMRNTEARRLGYRDFYAMSLALRDLDEQEMFGVLDRLREASDEPFRAFKAQLDQGLRQRFGLPEDAPLYPWHYGDPFFQEVPTVQGDVDLDSLFADRDLLDIARRFFHALGLEIDDILAVSDLYERPGKCQHAFSTRLNRDGDARILVNLRNTEKWASTLLHELGHAVYDKYIDLSMPWLLRTPAHMLYTEAVALFMGRFSKDEDWLRRYVGIDTGEAQRIVARAGHHARASQLVFARWGLVMTWFERELYRDPDQPLSPVWWRLVQEMQGVTPPEGRDRPDWAAKIHLATTPVYYQNYVLGELVASQMVRHLREVVLKDEAAPWEALVRSPAVGKWFIERVFRPGALRTWNDSVAYATGEPLNPQYFVDQFLTAY
jgi:peptidyl-dipeptidase A